MQWWNDIVDWFTSDSGQLVVYGAIIPFIAIVIAGLVAAAIGRGAVRRLVGQRDRETRASAVAALIAAGQTAARWHSQPPQTREHFEALAAAADVQVRLLPLNGANLAADWAAHELADMRVNSVSFSFQADQTLREYRDRLVEWLHKPGRAKRLFAADLERWRYDEPNKVDPVLLEQQEWAKDQLAAGSSSGSAAAPTATATTAIPTVSAPAATAAAPSGARNPAVERAAANSPTTAYDRRATAAATATTVVPKVADPAPPASSGSTQPASSGSTPPTSANAPKAAPVKAAKPTTKPGASEPSTPDATVANDADSAPARR